MVELSAPGAFPEPRSVELDAVAQLLATPTAALGGRIEVEELSPRGFQGRAWEYTWYDDNGVARQGYRIHENDETGRRLVEMISLYRDGYMDAVEEALILKAVLEKHGITAEQMAAEAKGLREGGV